ncbi:SAM-dependent methyltransferase [Clostridiales bacterium FE2010]|nr:SAM-dependent methyltransferase [Clostridiales bacterium FE2010]
MSRMIQLDARLSLAYDLYDPCDLAADIGTDHAHLPAALLQRGRCQHMILTDLSESALKNARETVIRCRLSDRTDLRAGDGLQPLEEACGMISITGMGGRTVHDILLEGAGKLRGASLVLSAHTDLPLIREAVCRIGYHLDREEPCFCAGRYYLVLRARPGACPLTPRELRLGGPLFESQSSQLIPYLTRRREVLQDKLRGLVSADKPEESLIAQVREDIAFYDGMIGKGRES